MILTIKIILAHKLLLTNKVSKIRRAFVNNSLCVIDIFRKYALVTPLINQKGATITKAFQEILDESSQKSSKMWIHKGNEFYNRSIKSWQQNNDIGMYSVV